MAVAFVQKIENQVDAAATTITATFPSNVTAGNVIVVGVSGDIAASSITLADGALGNTYLQPEAACVDAGNQVAYSAYAKNITGGACTITATYNVATGGRRIVACEYSGLVADPLVDSNRLQGAATALGTDGCPGPAVTGSFDLVVGIFQCTRNTQVITAGTNYLERAENPSLNIPMQIEDRIATLSDSQTPTWTYPTATDTYQAFSYGFRGVGPLYLYWTRRKARRGRRFPTLAK